MDEKQLVKVSTSLNDIELDFYEIKKVLDIIKIYTENKAYNSEAAENILFLIKILDKKYTKLNQLYENTHSDVLNVFKDCKNYL